MKFLPLSVFLLASFSSHNAFSQEVNMDDSIVQHESRVIETAESMNTGINNALMVVLEITDTRLADKVWKDFMRSYGGRVKRVRGGKEKVTVTDIVSINGVSPINIYSRSNTGMDGYVEQVVWFDLGEEFLSSRMQPQYAEAEKILMKYAFECKVQNTRNELKDAEKKLKSLEGDLNKLSRQHISYHQAIEDAERKIAEAKENILKNEEQQGETTQKIELQKELVEEINRRLSVLKEN